MNTIDYVALVKKSPMNLTADSEAKFTQLLKENFTEHEVQYFVANLYCSSKFSNDEFPIDLDTVWKFVGFAHKGNAKRMLENNFTLDFDYIVTKSSKIEDNLAYPSGEASLESNLAENPQSLEKNDQKWGGSNKETILLKIDTFKLLCMLAKTDRGTEIRRYYLKLESIVTSLIEEERQLFADQLQSTKDLVVQKDQELAKLAKCLKAVKIDNYIQFYYILVVENGKIKIGICSDLEATLKTYRRALTVTSFFWTWKFNDPKVAKICEDLIKSILVRFREKFNPETEVFNLDVNKIFTVAQNIIKIFDNPLSNVDKELEYFLNIFDKNNESSTMDKVLEKLEKIENSSIVQPKSSSSTPENVSSVPSSSSVTKTNSHNTSTNVTVNLTLQNPVIPMQLKEYKFVFFKKDYLQEVINGINFEKRPAQLSNVTGKRLILDAVNKYIIETGGDIDANRVPNSILNSKSGTRLPIHISLEYDKSDAGCGYSNSFAKDVSQILTLNGFSKYGCTGKKNSKNEKKANDVSGFHLRIVNN